MRVLICGDIVGKSGRNAIRRELPNLKQLKQIDFVLANGENAANGFGITKKFVRNFTLWVLMLLLLVIISGIKKKL